MSLLHLTVLALTAGLTRAADWRGLSICNEARFGRAPRDVCWAAFSKWVADEKRFLKATNWDKILPKCPDSIKKTSYGYDCPGNEEFTKPKVSSDTIRYHCGAACMRTKWRTNGHGQQCCYYPRTLQLIRWGHCAGTPDRAGVNQFNIGAIGHWYVDVVPFRYAEYLEEEGLAGYLAARPPNQGGGKAC